MNTAAKSLQIFPNSLNGIGLTGCGGANGLDAGINTNSFNVLLAQTLALSYNILYVSNYTRPDHRRPRLHGSLAADQRQHASSRLVTTRTP